MVLVKPSPWKTLTENHHPDAIPARQIQRQLAQEHGSRMAQQPVIHSYWGHIRKSQRSTCDFRPHEDLSEHRVLSKVTLDEGHIRNTVHLRMSEAIKRP